jgi:copper homeostasis protein
MDLAGGLPVTLHRCFDVCRDAAKTLEEAIDLGVTTVLTSGQRENAWAGRETIGALLRQAGDRIDILIGGGVDAKTIRAFRQSCPTAHAFHLSGKAAFDSAMTYRNAHVSMGLPGISEFTLYRTDREKVREASEALRG